jgi:hypothetical protein
MWGGKLFARHLFVMKTIIIYHKTFYFLSKYLSKVPVPIFNIDKNIFLETNLEEKVKLNIIKLCGMSEWLLFNANSAIFQLYHGENKVIFN